MLISLDDAKRQCRLELDDTSEDEHLTVLIEAAIAKIENDTNKQLIAVDQTPVVSTDPDSGAVVPPYQQQLTPALRMAALLLISHWYTNREAVVTGTIATTMPLAYESLIQAYRELAVG